MTNHVARVLEILLNCDDQGKPGELPAHAWPGGYAMFYLTRGGDTLCAKCATEDLKTELAGEGSTNDDPPIACGAFGATDDYPEEDEMCQDCGVIICEGSKTS
jgi:hypothetical protein